MTHICNTHNSPAHSRRFMQRGVMARVTGIMASIRAAKASRIAKEHLSHHSDAQLADIGLHRADLAAGRFEKAADARAQAIMRLYR